MSDDVINYKIVVIGKSATGKSAIMIRFTDDRFIENYLTTIGVDFKFRSLKIENQNFKLQIWDTAGQEKYSSITKTFYKGAHAVVLVFDITDRSSFLDIEKTWLKEVNKGCDGNIQLVLIGNKIDLNNQRVVTTQEAQEFAEKNNLLYFETSAKTGENIDKTFFCLTQEIYQKNKSEDPLEEQGQSLVQDQNKFSMGQNCCKQFNQSNYLQQNLLLLVMNYLQINYYVFHEIIFFLHKKSKLNKKLNKLLIQLMVKLYQYQASLLYLIFLQFKEGILQSSFIIKFRKQFYTINQCKHKKATALILSVMQLLKVEIVVKKSKQSTFTFGTTDSIYSIVQLFIFFQSSSVPIKIYSGLG